MIEESRRKIEGLRRDALKLLNAEGDESVATELDELIKRFKCSLTTKGLSEFDLDKRGITFKELREFFLRLARHADRMTCVVGEIGEVGEVLWTDAISRRLAGTDAIPGPGHDVSTTTKYFELHHRLKEFAQEQRNLAARVPTKGGRRNVRTMLMGRAEWWLALDLCSMYAARCSKPTRGDFEKLYWYVHEIAAGKSLPEHSHIARDAYRVSREMLILTKKVNKIHRRLKEPGLSSSERKELEAQLAEITDQSVDHGGGSNNAGSDRPKQNNQDMAIVGGKKKEIETDV